MYEQHIHIYFWNINYMHSYTRIQPDISIYLTTKIRKKRVNYQTKTNKKKIQNHLKTIGYNAV